LFQAAHKGTLFLDDVNELPLNVQTKLLDVLQRQVLRPVGADREMRIDTRIIAAANQPLAILVQQQRFRADLYHRLNVVRLVLPPLRKRPRDLPALVLTFAHRHRHIYPDIEAVDRELTQHLEVQPFEGNLRELEHAVQRMLFLKTEGATLVLSDWQAQDVQFFGESNQDLLRTAAEAAWRAIRKGGMTYGMALRQIERNLLEAALSGANTRREAAARLQTSERTLYHKLRFHGLSRASGRAQATANSR
jgi:DNA-binding NtrC family response regulator